ncbi:MAG: ATP-binding protein [Clostridia bacterium]|nr:ATP-binding protein [Clostridia bacterium]
MIHEIRKALQEEFAARRARAKALGETKRQKAYVQCPELKYIEEQLNALHILRVYLKLRKPLPNQVVETMKQLLPELDQGNAVQVEASVARLKQRKQALLDQLHLTEQDFRPVFTCTLCDDTGFLKDAPMGTPCNCAKIILVEKLREKANLPSDLDTFARFDASLYPDEPNAELYGIPQSPRQHMLKMKEICETFVERFTCSDTPNLLFVGRSGVGKTFFSSCVASGLLEQGVPVLYMPVSTLFKPFAAAAFASDEEKEMLQVLKDLILNVELLIIDDLGSEKQTATRYEELLEILNTRELNGRKHPCKTIITTNMTPKNLFDTYGERVASRILGTFDVLRFCGDDIRLKRKMG